MAKVDTLSDVESLQNETTAVNAINLNKDRIAAAFENTLSLDGSTPNAMEANLDLGSHRIINLAEPVDDNDAVRKVDLDTATGGLDADLIADIEAAETHATNAAASAAAAAASAAEAAAHIGAATSADRWTTARTLTLGGDLTGSQSFDGSANFTLTATIAADTIGDSELEAGAAVANIGYTPANKAGDTFTGDVVLASAPASLSITSAGFRGIPINTQDADYTLVIGDAGKMIRHTDTTARAYTIPPNSSVAFPVGTTVAVRNVGTGAVTLTQGAGVSIRIAGASTTGNKTVAQWGLCTIVKEDTDVWVATGTGVS